MQQMSLDGRDRDVQAVSNLGVAQSIANQPYDSQFTLGKSELDIGVVRWVRGNRAEVVSEIEFDVRLHCLALLPLGPCSRLAHPQEAQAGHRATAYAKNHFG